MFCTQEKGGLSHVTQPETNFHCYSPGGIPQGRSSLHPLRRQPRHSPAPWEPLIKSFAGKVGYQNSPNSGAFDRPAIPPHDLICGPHMSSADRRAGRVCRGTLCVFAPLATPWRMGNGKSGTTFPSTKIPRSMRSCGIFMKRFDREAVLHIVTGHVLSSPFLCIWYHIPSIVFAPQYTLKFAISVSKLLHKYNQFEGFPFPFHHPQKRRFHL